MTKADIIEQYEGGGIDFYDSDLSGQDLRGLCVPYASFRDSDLRNCDLTDADLTGCNLTGADLRGATLVRVTLTGADLTGARWK